MVPNSLIGSWFKNFNKKLNFFQKFLILEKKGGIKAEG
jgi:hypothetical protein